MARGNLPAVPQHIPKMTPAIPGPGLALDLGQNPGKNGFCLSVNMIVIPGLKNSK